MENGTLTYEIASSVFDRFPGYVRGVVLAINVNNTSPAPDLVSLLRQTEEDLRSNHSSDGWANHPRIASWRAAYQAFGAKPSEYRSSVESMSRRILNGNSLPSISPLVDIGNLLSVKYLVPAGSHALDHVISNLELRPANGNETFVAFGSDKIENPQLGEIVFVEENKVLTRRWTWRQAQHTLTLPESHYVEFNVDGLPPVQAGEIEIICEELADLVIRFCGGTQTIRLLTKENPQIELS